MLTVVERFAAGLPAGSGSGAASRLAAAGESFRPVFLPKDDLRGPCRAAASPDPGGTGAVADRRTCCGSLVRTLRCRKVGRYPISGGMRPCSAWAGPGVIFTRRVRQDVREWIAPVHAGRAMAQGKTAAGGGRARVRRAWKKVMAWPQQGQMTAALSGSRRTTPPARSRCLTRAFLSLAAESKLPGDLLGVSPNVRQSYFTEGD